MATFHCLLALHDRNAVSGDYNQEEVYSRSGWAISVHVAMDIVQIRVRVLIQAAAMSDHEMDRIPDVAVRAQHTNCMTGKPVVILKSNENIQV